MALKGWLATLATNGLPGAARPVSWLLAGGRLAGRPGVAPCPTGISMSHITAKL